MKLKFKVIALVMVIALMAPGFGFAMEDKGLVTMQPAVEVDVLTQERLDEMLEDIDPEILAIMERQAPAVEAAGKLHDAIRDNADIYANEYGGDYINDEHKLVVQLVGRTQEMEAKYLELCEGYELVFEDVIYSYDFLLGLEVMIPELLTNFRIKGYAVDVLENCLEIYVDSIDVDGVTNYLERRRTLLPVKIGSSSSMEMAQPVSGGTPITTNGSTCTIAVGGTYGSQNAFLTCGHYMNVNATVKLTVSGDTLGKVAYTTMGTPDWQTYNSDFSIITATGIYTSQNSVRFNNFITGIADITTNQVLSRYGQETGLGTVTVKKIGVTRIDCEYDSGPYRYITGLIAATVNSVTPEHGDSGGALFASGKFAGVFHGYGVISIYENTDTYAFFTPAYAIHNKVFNGSKFMIKTS